MPTVTIKTTYTDFEANIIRMKLTCFIVLKGSKKL